MVDTFADLECTLEPEEALGSPHAGLIGSILPGQAFGKVQDLAFQEYLPKSPRYLHQLADRYSPPDNCSSNPPEHSCEDHDIEEVRRHRHQDAHPDEIPPSALPSPLMHRSMVPSIPLPKPKPILIPQPPVNPIPAPTPNQPNASLSNIRLVAPIPAKRIHAPHPHIAILIPLHKPPPPPLAHRHRLARVVEPLPPHRGLVRLPFHLPLGLFREFLLQERESDGVVAGGGAPVGGERVGFAAEAVEREVDAGGAGAV